MLAATGRVASAADDSAVRQLSRTVIEQAYPRYLTVEPEGSTEPGWDSVYDLYPDLQYVLVGPGGDGVAQINCVPLGPQPLTSMLPEEGCDWAFAAGTHLGAAKANRLCIVSVSVVKSRQSEGIAMRLIQHVIDRAQRMGLSEVVLAVRPVGKAQYPLTPIGRYLSWRRSDGLPFDAWVRANVRAGARQLHACPRSSTIVHAISDWERFTGLRFPETGTYVIPEAYAPLEVNVEAGTGTYVEPNVWMAYRLREEPSC